MSRLQFLGGEMAEGQVECQKFTQVYLHNETAAKSQGKTGFEKFLADGIWKLHPCTVSDLFLYLTFIYSSCLETGSQCSLSRPQS